MKILKIFNFIIKMKCNYLKNKNKFSSTKVGLATLIVTLMIINIKCSLLSKAAPPEMGASDFEDINMISDLDELKDFSEEKPSTPKDLDIDFDLEEEKNKDPNKSKLIFNKNKNEAEKKLEKKENNKANVAEKDKYVNNNIVPDLADMDKMMNSNKSNNKKENIQESEIDKSEKN